MELELKSYLVDFNSDYLYFDFKGSQQVHFDSAMAIAAFFSPINFKTNFGIYGILSYQLCY